MAYGHRAMLAGANLWASNPRTPYLFDTYLAQVDWCSANLTRVCLTDADRIVAKASGGLPGSGRGRRLVGR